MRAISAGCFIICKAKGNSGIGMVFGLMVQVGTYGPSWYLWSKLGPGPYFSTFKFSFGDYEFDMRCIRYPRTATSTNDNCQAGRESKAVNEKGNRNSSGEDKDESDGQDGISGVCRGAKKLALLI